MGMFSRIGCAVLLAGMVAMLGGCAEKDDGGDKSRGGSSTSYPPAPTVLPTLAGLNNVINTSGGTSTSGPGGSAGAISLLFGEGRMLPESGQSRPSVNNNFLTAAVLAGGTVTYTELSTIDPTAFSVSPGGLALLSVRGADFFVPPGVTLNLSDAPAGVSVLQVVCQLAGDVARIDGDVLTARAGATSVAFEVRVLNGSGAVLSVDGTINTGATSAGASAGNVGLYANNGGVVVGGTIIAAGSGGTGGATTIASGADLVLREGIIRCDGGDGTTTGGFAGNMSIYGGTAGTIYFPWALVGNGGDGDTIAGGQGMSVDIEVSAVFDAFFVIEASGGDSTSGSGGGVRLLYLYVHTLTGAIDITRNGGSSTTGNGGSANAQFDISPVNCWGFLINMSGVGGSGAAGGNGGTFYLYGFGGVIANAVVTVDVRGGQGDGAGGQGGNFSWGGSQDILSTTATVNASGGEATGANGTGGNGGAAYFYPEGWQGHTVGSATLNVVARGGSGNTGGAGGSCQADPRYGSTSMTLDATVDVSGGTGVNGSGGDGGDFSALVDDLTNNVSAVLDVVADGGSTTNGSGGEGGEIEIGSWSGDAEFSGTISARGGSSTNDTGESGGLVEVYATWLGTVRLVNLDIDVTGGESDGDDAGSGGDIFLYFWTPVVLEGGVWNASGGTSNGTEGGSGGSVQLYGYQVDLDVRTDLRADGGAGTGTAGGGDGGLVLATCDSDVTAAGAQLRIYSTVTARGGDSAGATRGGNGGTLDLYSGAASGQGAGSLLTAATATLSAAGGDSPGTGGDGGNVYLHSSGTTNEVLGTVTAAGGSTGTNGGNGGQIHVSGSDLTDLVVNSRLDASGGNGTSAGGDGGVVDVGVWQGFDEASATLGASAQLLATGGALNGDGGTVTIDVIGAGGLNVSQDPGAVIDADPDGTGAAGTVTID